MKNTITTSPGYSFPEVLDLSYAQINALPITEEEKRNITLRKYANRDCTPAVKKELVVQMAILFGNPDAKQESRIELAQRWLSESPTLDKRRDFYKENLTRSQYPQTYREGGNGQTKDVPTYLNVTQNGEKVKFNIRGHFINLLLGEICNQEGYSTRDLTQGYETPMRDSFSQRDYAIDMLSNSAINANLFYVAGAEASIYFEVQKGKLRMIYRYCIPSDGNRRSKDVDFSEYEFQDYYSLIAS